MNPIYGMMPRVGKGPSSRFLPLLLCFEGWKVRGNKAANWKDLHLS